jgi:hypothetical protein
MNRGEDGTAVTHRVLYVAGTGRSGSTLLARILDRAEGVFAAGEVRYLWQRGLLEDRLCGCGERFSECPFWSDVLERAFGARGSVDAQRVMADQRAVTRLRHVPKLLAQKTAGVPSAYLDQLSRLYRAVAEVSGCELVVDSSKLPSYGYVLRGVAGLDVRIVHLVRDPRGAAYSWARSKARTDSAGSMQQMSILKSSSLWLAWNASAPRLFDNGTPYSVVRYEDLVASPRQVVDDILRFAGHRGDGAPFVGERTVALGRSHTVAGNPNRLEAGQIELREDQAWTTALARPKRALVTAVTTPLLGRFDYPLVVKQGPLRDLTVPQ